MRLVIISHTEHYTNSGGIVSGWGATVREINHLTTLFDRVIHVAPLYQGPPPAGYLSYASDKIEFVPLTPSGGETFFSKLDVLAKAPHNLKIIREQLKACDVFQFRAPTGMGVYVIPYLLLFSKKKGWFKYAGNWVQENPPLGYKLQRMMLNSQSRKFVTINGRWPGQKPNQLTFENPCLTQYERDEGQQAVQSKDYSTVFNFIFIGRLEDAKGVQRILNVFSAIDNPRIGKIHFVGDGQKKDHYQEYARTHCNRKQIIFHGFLPRTEINELLKTSHFFLLPSSSEGFPKVIAEAANYGVIPIVSDVSSIGQYIRENQTGFVVSGAREDILRQKIEHAISLPEITLQTLAANGHLLAEPFTYSHYTQRIEEEIIR